MLLLQLNLFQISFHIIIEVKPLQTKIFNKTSQVEELKSMLEMKNETVKELDSQVKGTLQDGQWINDY